MPVTRGKLAKHFCKCVKKVRRTIKLRRGQSKGAKQRGNQKESAAIAICTKSILQTKGLTLRKVDCWPKPMLNYQSKRALETRRSTATKRHLWF